ncbi:MAG TPA: carboxypeptidase-like regulatory domain-containing protein, partial [Pyrinomonadaceae bacterium]
MRKFNWRIFPALLAALALAASAAEGAGTSGGARRASGLGTISGAVLDARGNPVSGALVKILRDGFNEVVKETKSAPDGSFAARVTPGRYLIRALADGFTPATFSSVEVSPSTELVYRFNLQPAGSGNTAPERRADRQDPKFRIRAAHARRSIFNAGDSEDETVRQVLAELEDEEQAEDALADEALASGDAPEGERTNRTRTQGYVETFFATSGVPGRGGYAGVNFAVATPVNRQVQMIFAGQAGEFERLEATARIRAGARHRLSATFGGARLPLVPKTKEANSPLGFGRGEKLEQVSVRAV